MEKRTAGYHIRTGLVVLLCALIVLGFRLGYFPVATIVAGGIAIPLSDFFIILGAGLCGYQYGLGMFLFIFFTEIILERGNLDTLFPLFLYLILALTSGYSAKNRWYQKLSFAGLTALILEVELGNIFYLIFVYIFGGADTDYLTTIIGTLPETIAAVGILYLYYRFAPERIKRSFGLGYLYTKDSESAKKKKDGLHLGRHITILSMTEGVVFGIIALILMETVLDLFGDSLKFPENISPFVLRVAVFLLALTLSISVAVIVNEVIIGSVVSVVRKQDKLETDLQIAEAGSEAKSAFLSNMSHEIRTPINAVLGMNEMILRESKEQGTIEYAENIRTAGNSLLGLVNDILDFSKIEAGKMDIIPVEYEFSSVLNDLVNMIQIRAEKKGLKFVMRINPEIPNFLYGDEIRLKQVVTNILTNAVKYTEKGSVTLTVDYKKKVETDLAQAEAGEADAGQTDQKILLEIHVKDTGIGIKEEDQKKLFTAFERIEEERNRNIEGTGLGMNITTSLLSMMESELRVNSVYGQGSDFYFSLEQKVVKWDAMGDFKEAFRRSAASRKAYRESFQAPDARILVVDDTVMNLTVFKGLLKQTKIKIDTAESGRECLDKMKEAAYDMIFLDHQMPEMDGIETRKQMDALEGNKNIGIPVIALTANAVSGAREIYMANGFTDYLTKPIDTVALEKMLVQYIPEEKVILTDADTSSSGESPTEEFSEEKLSWEGLSAIRSMDISFAKLHLPDTELLQKALSDFYQVIDIQAEKLDGMYQAVRKEMEHPGTEQREMEQPGMESFKKKPETEQSDALSAYRIQVHGMKSSAAIIGLTGLSGMARILEFAAQDGKAEKILELHEIFLEKWRDMKEEMRGVWGLGEETDDSSAEEFNQNEVNGLLEVLRTSMEEFDLDRADAVVEKLKEYSYHEDRKEKMSRLYAAVADVDAETADCIIQELMALQ